MDSTIRQGVPARRYAAAMSRSHAVATAAPSATPRPPKWLGRCPSCGAWNSLVEDHRPRRAPPRPVPAAGPVADRRGRPHGGGGVPTGIARARPRARRRARPRLGHAARRRARDRQEHAAAPGAGAHGRRRRAGACSSCAEESEQQVRLRAGRLGALAPSLLVVAETSLPADRSTTSTTVAPDVLAVDSIQTVVRSRDRVGAGLGRCRCARARTGSCALAKERGDGHRARRPRHQGRLARRAARARARRRHRARVRGRPPPRAPHAARAEAPLRHHQRARRLRDGRGRADRGARPVGAVPRRPAPGLPGSVVAAGAWRARARCSSRCRRSSRDARAGAAALARRASTAAGSRCCSRCSSAAPACAVGGFDVYASVAGGVRVPDAGADLAVALAVASAQPAPPVPADLVAVGEVGLGGELRQAPQTARRLGEAARLGFRAAIVPHSTPDVPGIRLLRAEHIGDVLTRSSSGDDRHAAIRARMRGSRRAQGSLGFGRCGPVPPGGVGAGRLVSFRLLPRTHRPAEPSGPLDDRDAEDLPVPQHPDPKRCSPLCASSPRGGRCARVSTASCRRRWARSSSSATAPTCSSLCSGGFLLDAEFTPAAAVGAGEDGRRHHPLGRLHRGSPAPTSTSCPTPTSPRARPAPGTAPPSGSPSRSTCR